MGVWASRWKSSRVAGDNVAGQSGDQSAWPKRVCCVMQAHVWWACPPYGPRVDKHVRKLVRSKWMTCVQAGSTKLVRSYGAPASIVNAQQTDFRVTTGCGSTLPQNYGRGDTDAPHFCFHICISCRELLRKPPFRAIFRCHFALAGNGLAQRESFDSDALTNI